MSTGAVSRVASWHGRLAARTLVGASILFVGLLPACSATQAKKPAAQPVDSVGFLPKDSRIRIVKAEDAAGPGWTRERITRPFDDTEDGSQAMIAFIKQAEQQGAEALSEVELRARTTRDGKPVTCVTNFYPTMKTETKSEPQWQPGYPPQLEHVMVTREVWSLTQTKPSCIPRAEAVKTLEKPHEFVGYMHKAR